jgi:radical SAM superfamily enzyme YgiQ (UPF0313 family)
MSKVLFINPAVRVLAKPNNAPLGLLYIAAYLELHGHTVDICDLNALRAFGQNREFWLARCKAHYDIIGLSGLITTYQEQRFILDYIVENKRAFGDPMLISGGGLATSVPEFTLRNMPELDALVIGEGEVTALELANGAALPSVKGIITRDGANDPRTLIPRLDDLPFPRYDRLPVEVYLKNPIWGTGARNSTGIEYVAKRSLNMIVSRGCTHHCSFCYHDIWGKKYRLRSVENVIDEIRQMKAKYNIDFIGLVDDNTIADDSWTAEFCKELASVGIHWGCHARVDQVNPDKLALMRASGCEYVGFGIESASPKILENMNKKADPEQAAQAVKWVREAGIYANGTFIAGYPGETKETLAETARFMKETDMLGNMFFATAYPGTALYEEKKDVILERYSNEDAYIKLLGDATEFSVNLSDMNDDDLFWCRDMAIGGIPF